MGAVKSKTMWFAFALVIAGFVQSNVGALVPVAYQGIAVTVIGLVVGLLRTQTDTALADK